MVNETVRQFINEMLYPGKGEADRPWVFHFFAGLLVFAHTNEAFSLVNWLGRTTKKWSDVTSEEMGCVLSVVRVGRRFCYVCLKSCPPKTQDPDAETRSHDCKLCGMVRFCSRKCNKLAYQTHKKFCPLLSRAREFVMLKPKDPSCLLRSYCASRD